VSPEIQPAVGMIGAAVLGVGQEGAPSVGCAIHAPSVLCLWRTFAPCHWTIGDGAMTAQILRHRVRHRILPMAQNLPAVNLVFLSH
jgi:hypothetical protein